MIIPGTRDLYSGTFSPKVLQKMKMFYNFIKMLFLKREIRTIGTNDLSYQDNIINGNGKKRKKIVFKTNLFIDRFPMLKKKMQEKMIR